MVFAFTFNAAETLAHPTAWVVLAFAFIAADGSRRADTATTANAAVVDGIIHTTAAGSNGKRHDQPRDGGVIIPAAMHGREHEYTPTARVVLASSLTTADSSPCGGTATTTM